MGRRWVELAAAAVLIAPGCGRSPAPLRSVLPVTFGTRMTTFQNDGSAHTIDITYNIPPGTPEDIYRYVYEESKRNLPDYTHEQLATKAGNVLYTLASSEDASWGVFYPYPPLNTEHRQTARALWAAHELAEKGTPPQPKPGLAR